MPNHMLSKNVYLEKIRSEARQIMMWEGPCLIIMMAPRNLVAK